VTRDKGSALTYTMAQAQLAHANENSDARRTLWGFVSALFDNERLIALWARIADKGEWDVLRRALKAQARGLPAAREVEMEPS
jgi:hypothetical protein